MKIEDRYLLRRGMMIRKHMAKKVLGVAHLDEQSPNYVEKRKDGSLQGTELLIETLNEEDIPYEPDRFKTFSPDFYRELVTNGERKLRAKDIKEFESLDQQMITGFRSGLLKYDTRGYYLSSRFDGR